MRWVYISPHLDDAIWSTGGLMYEQTQARIPVEVWTVMSGIPAPESPLTDFAKMLHSQWGTNSADETIQMRKRENNAAAAIVGAKAVYFDFLDSMYRCDPNGEALYVKSFAKPHKVDANLPAEIATAISKRLNKDDIVVCPLALGKHIDHFITRKAVELLSRSLYFYADVPYLLNKPGKLKYQIYWMKEFVQPVSENGVHIWLQAIAAYQSQIPVEFQTTEAMQTKIYGYWFKYKGIRLWRVK